MTFDVTVDSGIVEGAIVSNQATIEYDSDGDGINDAAVQSDGDTSAPGYQFTDLPLGGRVEGVAIKRVTDENGGNLEPGDILLYTIVWENQTGYDFLGL